MDLHAPLFLVRSDVIKNLNQPQFLPLPHMKLSDNLEKLFNIGDLVSIQSELHMVKLSNISIQTLESSHVDT